MKRWLLPLLGALALMLAQGAGAGGIAGSPRVLYTLHCSGCHLPDGSGMPGKGIPDMRGTLGHFLRLPEGRAFVVQVPGVVNTPLDDAQVAALTNWMLREMASPSVPGDAPLYTASEVRALRAARPADVAARRTAIAQRLAAMGYPVQDAAATTLEKR